jgi:hypothetical protein
VAGTSGVGPALSAGVPFDAASTTGLLSAGFAHGGVFALGERDLLGGGRRVLPFGYSTTIWRVPSFVSAEGFTPLRGLRPR